MPSLPRIRRSRGRTAVADVAARSTVAELSSAGLTWVHVTAPDVELLPVTRLFNRCAEDEDYREQLFSKGSGRLLYEVLDDLFDYCFPILDKIAHKLDRIEDDIHEVRSEELVRDI